MKAHVHSLGSTALHPAATALLPYWVLHPYSAPVIVTLSDDEVTLVLLGR